MMHRSHLVHVISPILLIAMCCMCICFSISLTLNDQDLHNYVGEPPKIKAQISFFLYVQVVKDYMQSKRPKPT